MKNLRNIFKEYNDPKIFKDMRVAFAALAICGLLLAFVVSPSFRQTIGVEDNKPIGSPPAKVIQGNNHQKTPTKQKGKLNGHHSAHQKRVHSNSHHSVSHPTSNGNTGIGSPTITQPGGSGNGNTGNPQAPPGSPPSNNPSSPTESNPPSESSNGNGGSEGTGSGGSTNEGAKIGIELNVPPITNIPPMEEVTKGLNETINGVTGGVNEVTKELPIHVEVPPVCLVKC